MNKRTNSVVLALVGLLFSIQGASAQMKWNSAYQSYIDQYKDLAIEQMLRYNIPASITLAQGLFESAAGRSNLTRSGNNHFGIKCHGWTGKRTYHDDDAAGECFRAYDNARQSYEDHSRFLATQCGYATNPQYASKLTQIIELYGLNKYDRATTYDRFIAKHASEESPGPDGVRYVIKAYNDNYYVIAKKGETFKSLGKELGISGRKLAKYNERDKRETLDDGDVIYLKKKRNKAERNFKNRPHTVKAGESMYSIAQKYGIRLKSLYKKNRLSPDYNIRVGDKLRVY